LACEVADDSREPLVCEVSLPGQVPFQELGSHVHTTERIADLMGERSRGGADSGQALALNELLLQPDLLRNITNERAVADLPIGLDFGDRELDGKHFAIF